MKKYKLIELLNGCRITLLGVYDKYEEAALEILKRGKCTSYYYRIAEFEESIMDRVKSYKDACEVAKENSLTEMSLCEYKDGAWEYFDELPDHIIALLKLETITAALNEGWKPDWEDTTQDIFTNTYTTKQSCDS